MHRQQVDVTTEALKKPHWKTCPGGLLPDLSLQAPTGTPWNSKVTSFEHYCPKLYFFWNISPHRLRNLAIRLKDLTQIGLKLDKSDSNQIQIRLMNQTQI